MDFSKRWNRRPCETVTILVLIVGLRSGVGESAVPDTLDLRRTAIVRAVERAKPAVVSIHGHKIVGKTRGVPPGVSETSRRVNGMGTGVVVDHRGYIVTNHHVVEGVRRIQVTLVSGETLIARLVAHDSLTDLAILKVKTDSQLPLIPIGTSHDLMQAEPVVAIGNAFGYGHTVTRGVISALDRTVKVSDTQRYDNLIQTDASINPGNSGGPLLNIEGEMIGINVAVRTGAQGIGFAIPSDDVMDGVVRLLNVERVDRKWHGIVTGRPQDGVEAVVVSQVKSGSPGHRAGFRTGDRIQSVGSVPVRHSLDFERAFLGRRRGEKVQVTIERDQRAQKLNVALAALPRETQPIQDRTWNMLGLRVRRVPAKQVRSKSSFYNGGLVVTEVRSGGPADAEGIRHGDILVGMHEWETAKLADLTYILSSPEIATLEEVRFYILRGRSTFFGDIYVARRVSH